MHVVRDTMSTSMNKPCNNCMEIHHVGATHGLGSTPWPNGPRWRKGVATKFYGLGTMNIVPLHWRTWSYYQSMSLELRYGHGKVLGTQDRSTHGLNSTHCVLHLNPIKAYSTLHLKHIHRLAYI